MANRKKPTIMEMKTVVTNALIQLERLENYIRNIDSAFSGYLEYKKATTEFREWFVKKMEEVNESRSKESGDSSGATGTGKAGKEASKKSDKKTGKWTVPN